MTYCGLVGGLEPSVIRTDMWIPFRPLRTLRVGHMYIPTVGGRPCLQPRPLDADTAEIILPSVDAFQVQALGMTLQELRSKGTKTSRSVDDFLDAPSLSSPRSSPTDLPRQACACHCHGDPVPP